LRTVWPDAGVSSVLGELAGCLSLAHAKLPQINQAAALPIVVEAFIAGGSSLA
jgi:hypothetical protein